ncbi:MAG TPA: AbrB/MazE/SpoVT family DNA-binding domain-containing protein [Firmicutes bacterium]|nr:AbrB/MazE/SpoVT family DNA-binding domain-containing protein [Bacillota bacterium]
MIKTLTTHGNSAALIIDKPILELLNITMNTPLKIVTDGKNLIISPIDDVTREERFKNALAKINAEHESTLRKLAE